MTNTDSKAAITTTLIPFLAVRRGTEAVDFYKTAFGATVLSRDVKPNGKVMAHLSIEGAAFYLGDEEPEFGNLSPETIGGTSVRMILTVSDPDAYYARALAAGATQICPVTTEEDWRIGKLSDPFGNIWEIGHQLEKE